MPIKKFYFEGTKDFSEYESNNNSVIEKLHAELSIHNTECLRLLNEIKSEIESEQIFKDSFNRIKDDPFNGKTHDEFLLENEIKRLEETEKSHELHTKIAAKPLETSHN